MCAYIYIYINYSNYINFNKFAWKWPRPKLVRNIFLFTRSEPLNHVQRPYYITYILTLSAFCTDCQILYNNAMRHFFKTVIFPILRIFKGLLVTNRKCKKVYTNGIITKWKEQWIYVKEKWKSYKKVLKRFPTYKIKLVLKI